MRADQDRPDRMVCVIGGPEKTGKDHFAFTFPGPIYLQWVDPGVEGVIQKFQNKKEIQHNSYHVEISRGDAANPDLMAAAADQTWRQFTADFEYALANARTIIWDTETDFWALLRLARFGVLNPRTGKDRGNVWGPVNAEYERLLRAPFSKDMNFVLIQKCKDEYRDDKKTGGLVRSGFKDVDYIVQVVLQSRRVGNRFSLYIESCRDNPDVNETECPENDYETLKGMVIQP